MASVVLKTILNWAYIDFGSQLICFHGYRLLIKREDLDVSKPDSLGFGLQRDVTV